MCYCYVIYHITIRLFKNLISRYCIGAKIISVFIRLNFDSYFGINYIHAIWHFKAWTWFYWFIYRFIFPVLYVCSNCQSQESIDIALTYLVFCHYSEWHWSVIFRMQAWAGFYDRQLPIQHVSSLHATNVVKGN